MAFACQTVGFPLGAKAFLCNYRRPSWRVDTKSAPSSYKPIPYIRSSKKDFSKWKKKQYNESLPFTPLDSFRGHERCLVAVPTNPMLYSQVISILDNRWKSKPIVNWSIEIFHRDIPSAIDLLCLIYTAWTLRLTQNEYHTGGCTSGSCLLLPSSLSG